MDGFVDGVVQRYLDCGVFRAGFARVWCGRCGAEYLVACSCRGRGFCPSCGAKRAAEFSALLCDEVLEPVCHRMWTFTVPKMLRPYFLHHRRLLGKLCRAAYETVAAIDSLTMHKKREEIGDSVKARLQKSLDSSSLFLHKSFQK